MFGRDEDFFHSCMNLKWFWSIYVTMMTWKHCEKWSSVTVARIQIEPVGAQQRSDVQRSSYISTSSAPCWSLSSSLYFGSKPFVCFCCSSALIRPWCRLVTWLIKDAVTLHRNDAVSRVEVSTARRNVPSRSRRQQPECEAHPVLWTSAAEFSSAQTSASPGRRAAERPARKKRFSSGYKTQSQRGKTEAAAKLCRAAVMIRANHGLLTHGCCTETGCSSESPWN